MKSLLILALLASSLAPGRPAKEPYLVPIIDSYPAGRASVSGVYSCLGGGEIHLRIDDEGGHIRVLELSGFGRVAAPDQLRQWNDWLAVYLRFRAVAVECTAMGAVVFVSGARSEGQIRFDSVVVGWTEQGLSKISP